MAQNDLPPPSASNFSQRVRETLMVALGRTGDPLDRTITLRDLLDGGLAKIKTGFAIKSGMTGSLPLTATASDVEPDLTPPPTPSGFAVSAAISHVFIEHSAPTYTQGHGHLRTRVYGAIVTPSLPTPVFSNAVEITQFSGTIHSHPSNPSTTWRLWIKWETNDGVLSVSPAGGTNGLEAITGQNVALLLEALTGEITESQLYQGLGNRINLIDAPSTGLFAKVSDLQTTYGNTASSAQKAAEAAQSAADAAASEAAAILAQAGAVTAKDQSVTAKTSAETAASNASTSATSASNSATGAAGSASTANTWATNAANSATAAAGSATGAATSATTASSQATNAGNSATAANTSKVAAESAKDAALGSAVAASTSASTATTKATEAATSATSANTSATTATTKAGEASTSATSAATSASTATTKANEATTSATTSATLATNAANSATAAATSASTATTKATEAASSASSANTSATSAATSAGWAGTHSSNAATSATNAAGSASSAATALTQVRASVSSVGLIYNSSFEGGDASGWAGFAAVTNSPYGALPKAWAGVQTGRDILFPGGDPDKWFSCNPGEEFEVTAWVSAQYSSPIYTIGIQYESTNGTAETFTGVVSTTAPTTAKFLKGYWTAPADARRVRFWGQISTWGTENPWHITDVQLRRTDSRTSANSAAIQTEATARANADGTLFAQYTVKVDMNGYVSGYGLASTATNAAPTSEFAVRADKFYVASPSGPGVAPSLPFIVRTTPTTINGVNVPVGVYINDAYVQNGTITNAKIADLAVDNAKIANLGVSKLIAGSLAVGQYIKSTSYVPNTSGWIINADGTAEFSAASIRGRLTASQIDVLETANIANAAITNSKIANLAVDTLQIADNAVTVPTTVIHPYGISRNLPYNTLVTNILSFDMTAFGVYPTLIILAPSIWPATSFSGANDWKTLISIASYQNGAQMSFSSISCNTINSLYPIVMIPIPSPNLGPVSVNMIFLIDGSVPSNAPSFSYNVVTAKSFIVGYKK